MIDFFGTKRKMYEIKEMRKFKDDLREKLFEHILQNQNCLREMGVISTEEYYKWRFSFDLQRYNLNEYGLILKDTLSDK